MPKKKLINAALIFLSYFLAVAAQNSCAANNFSSKFQMKEDSPFGVVPVPGECTDERVPRLVKRLGATWIRQCIRWDFIEPKKGEFHWENTDAEIKNERKFGLSIFGQFHWYSWCDPRTGGDEAIKNWVNFVSKAVKRYKDKIKYWEVWNEEDFEDYWTPPNAAQYVKLLKATYVAAKKIDPECKIIMGGIMARGADSTNFVFLDEVYKNGGKDYFDIMAIHPYTSAYSPTENNLLRRKIDDVISRMKNNQDANKPIWITEMGWSSNKLLDPQSTRAVTPDQQAKYLVEALKILLSYPQIKKVIWLCMRDSGTNPSVAEEHYGLVKNNFEPKPAFQAYKEFISNWKNRKNGR